MKLRSLISLIVLGFCLSPVVFAGEIFQATSGENRTALLELYTSEGCSSCPPTEAWLAQLEKSGISREQVIPVALHVDYWDYIGWKDPYASAIHTQRQLLHQQRGGLPNIYTPQLVLNGQDLRPRRGLKSRLPSINNVAAPLRISLLAEYATPNNVVAKVSIKWLPGESEKGSLFLMLTEDGLETRINAGENSGRTLKHEHVVRSVVEALPLASEIDVNISIRNEWDKTRLGLIAFVETNNGEILQAVELRLH